MYVRSRPTLNNVVNNREKGKSKETKDDLEACYFFKRENYSILQQNRTFIQKSSAKRIILFARITYYQEITSIREIA